MFTNPTNKAMPARRKFEYQHRFKVRGHYRHGDNAGLRFRTTGKTRGQKSEGYNVHLWGDVAFEYECLDCGHTGWSRHPDVARKHELEHES